MNFTSVFVTHHAPNQRKPWGRGCINLQHVEWGKVLPTKHAIGFVKFFRGYLLVLCVDACINTLAFQDYKLQSASHHFISRQANSGVASVDNWRGASIHIFVFKDHKNSGSQKKLVTQNTIYEYSPLQLSTLATPVQVTENLQMFANIKSWY